MGQILPTLSPASALTPGVATLLRPERLIPWLNRDELQFGDEALRSKFGGGGRANAVVGIDRGGLAGVLRRPLVALRENEQSQLRVRGVGAGRAEHIDISCPALFAACEGNQMPSFNFLVMAQVEGWLGRRPIRPRGRGAAAHFGRDAAGALVNIKSDCSVWADLR